VTEPEKTVEPDQLVRSALQLLPVPSHEDGFWERLDAAISAQPVDGGDVASVESPAPRGAERDDTAEAPALELHRGPEAALVPASLRRRSNALAALGAVAAAVLVVVAGAALVRQRSGTDLDTDGVAAPAGTSTSAAANETSSPATTTTGDVEVASTDAVMSWVSALGDGDADGAWAALGPEAKAQVGQRSAFDGMMSELVEGYGDWAGARPEEVLVTPVVSSGPGRLLVVSLVGAVDQDGQVQMRAESFVVRITREKTEVEPFDTAGTVELVTPSATEGSMPTMDGDEIVVVVPVGADPPILRLDDGAVIVCGDGGGSELTAIEGTSGLRCSWTPDGGIPPGRRVLTVAFVGGSSAAVSAESVVFEAA